MLLKNLTKSVGLGQSRKARRQRTAGPSLPVGAELMLPGPELHFSSPHSLALDSFSSMPAQKLMTREHYGNVVFSRNLVTVT